MARTSSLAEVEIDVDAEPRPVLLEESDTPFRILIMGDFSGRSNRKLCDPKLAGRRPVLVDRDNFDEVMASLAVELSLGDLNLRFHELDDFHPDHLFARLEALRASGPPPELAGLSGADLLEQMLGASEDPPRRASRPRLTDDFQSLVRDIVAPHLVRSADPRKSEEAAQRDAAMGRLMSGLLHQPQFQALEAAWRGVFFLVRGLETGVDLKLYLLDVSEEELADDLGATEDMHGTALYRLLVGPSVRAEPWSVLAGNYTFDNSMGSVALLGRIARIAQAAGAPFLAGASPRILGCDSLEGTPDPTDWKSDTEGWWEALRHLPGATWLGLALPRFLLRLPYGKSTSRTEFAFEEMPGPPRHADYLWGNAAFICVYLLAEAFTNKGWDMFPGDVSDVTGLPVHLYKEDGETQSKPCAEGLLTDRASRAIADKGLMPLLSKKGGDTIRLARFQSIAKPPSQLTGPWT